MKRHDPVKIPTTESEETGLPFFQTWKAVYLFVLATFVFWIALLVALTEIFS
ncbi:MAG TPA: hypothetical protein VGH42_00900 [Verrucomicrobiae bacterium]|jgi:hypothetical protein